MFHTCLVLPQKGKNLYLICVTAPDPKKELGDEEDAPDQAEDGKIKFFDF